MSTCQPRPLMYVAVTCLAAVAVSCLYDPHNRCSAGEQLDENDVCVCLPDHVPIKRDITIVTPTVGERVPTAYCAPCGDNQVVSNETCVCRSGYVAGPNGCVPSNLGTTCAADADCASGDAKFCRLPDGYCTSSGCATNADCSKDADYACATDPAGSYCKRPPLKQGAPCSTQGMDPVCGTEAPICALGACTVLGCMVDTDCSPSRKCCDLSRFSPGVTLCLAVCP
jgi:hypothetical protein